MTQLLERELEEEPEAEEKPQDPRRAPQVVMALSRMSRRDPPHDAFKPVGRAAFLIWLVLAVGLVAVDFGTENHIERRALADAKIVAAQSLKELTGTPSERASVMRRMGKNPQLIAQVSVVGFAAGSGILAAYYVAIYLLALPLLKGGVSLGRGFFKHVLKPGWQKIKRASENARLQRQLRSGRTEAGVEPKLQ